MGNWDGLSCTPGLCPTPVLRRCLGGHWAPCRTLTGRRLLPFDVLSGVPVRCKGYKVWTKRLGEC